MSWVRVDDKFHSDPKILAAGNAAAGLFVRSIAYSADQLTDGLVPQAWARANGSPRERKQLLEDGLWVQEDKGFRIANYLRYNPTGEEVKELRRQRAEAGRRGGQASGQARAQASASHVASPEVEAKAQAKSNPTPTPLPKQPDSEVLSKEVQTFDKGSRRKRELPLDKTHQVARIVAAVWEHADEGTEGVVRSLAAQLPVGALAKVYESVTLSDKPIGNKAGYVVEALKSEIAERANQEHAEHEHHRMEYVRLVDQDVLAWSEALELSRRDLMFERWGQTKGASVVAASHTQAQTRA